MPKSRGGFNTFDPDRIKFHRRLGALARWAEGQRRIASPEELQKGEAEWKTLNGPATDEEGNEYEISFHRSDLVTAG
jgi:hypothetical protein